MRKINLYIFFNFLNFQRSLLSPNHHDSILSFQHLQQILFRSFISLIAPPAIYLNKPYRAFLTTSNFSTDTEVAIKLRKEEIFYKVKADDSQESTQKRLVTFEDAGKVTRQKKTQFNDGQFGYELNLFARQNNKCVNKTIILIASDADFYAFIQLDKPFYKPNDEIKYRIVAFDFDTKPIAFNNILVEIKDSYGNLVRRQEDLEHQKYRGNGLFEDKFKISDEPNLGLWIISVKINNNIKLAAEKKFKVEETQLPFYEVVIESRDVYHLDEKDMEIKFYGFYAFKQYAKGLAILKISYNETSTNKVRNLFYRKYPCKDTFQTVKLNFRRDLKINFMANPSMTLDVSVEFMEEAATSHQKKIKQITILRDKSYSFEIIQPYPFERGLEYEFIAMVRNFKGELLTSSDEPVKMSYTITSQGQSSNVSSEHSYLSDSEALFKIPKNITRDIEKITIELQYLSSKTEMIIKPDIKLSKTLRVTIDKPFIEEGFQDDLVGKVEFSLGLKGVVAFVVGRYGIAYAEYYDCHGNKSCSLPLDGVSSYYHEMMPEARLVVYSIEHHDKQVLSGSTSFKFYAISSNKVNIAVPEKTSPKQKIEVDVTSQPNSLVSILAIDKKLTFVRKGHDITKQDVVNVLTNTTKYAYKNNNDSDVTLDEENHNFVINLALNNWHICTDDENKLLNKINKTGIAPHSSNGGLLIQGDDTDQVEITPEATEYEIDDTIVRKDFPETWIWKTLSLNDKGIGKLSHKVPDSMTTWLFTGFSISNEGFAIAEPREILSTQEFFIEPNFPYSIKFGEIVDLKVVAFNYLSQFTGNIEVELKIIAQHGGREKQFEFMQLVHRGGSCKSERVSGTNRTINLLVPHKNGALKSFSIRPLIVGDMLIRIEAKARNTVGQHQYFYDAIEKVLIVENEGVAYFDTKNFELKLNNETTIKSHQFTIKNIRREKISLTAVIAGDMMGPTLNFNSKLFQLPSGCGEQTMAKYGKTLWLLTYLKNIKKLTPEDEKKGKEDLSKGYQHMLKYRNSNGGFSVFTSCNASTWLTAYTAYIIGSAMQTGAQDEDKSVVEKALLYCRDQQNSDGSFTKNNYYLNTWPEQKKLSESVQFTSFVLLAFLKNRDFTGIQFNDTIQKALSYIKTETDIDNYAAATASYAISLYEPGINSSFLSMLERVSENDGDNMYWNLHKGNNTGQRTKILISSCAAMAYIKSNLTEKAKPIIRWLLKQRDPYGGFYDSHTSVIANEALAMMAEQIKASNTEIRFRALGYKKQYGYTLTDSNALTPYAMEMPTGTINLHMQATGRGYGIITTYYEYYNTVKQLSSTFHLDVNGILLAESYANITSCFKRAKASIADNPMVMLEVSLLSGFIYVGEMTKPMEQDSTIQNVEVRRGGTLITMYMEDFEINQEKCIFVMAKEKNKVDFEKKASVKLYEYNERDTTFTSAFYGLRQAGCLIK